MVNTKYTGADDNIHRKYPQGEDRFTCNVISPFICHIQFILVLTSLGFATYNRVLSFTFSGMVISPSKKKAF